MVETLETKTGRSLAAWMVVAASAPVDGFMERVDWLKSEHGLGHFQARLVAEEFRDSGGSG